MQGRGLPARCRDAARRRASRRSAAAGGETPPLQGEALFFPLDFGMVGGIETCLTECFMPKADKKQRHKIKRDAKKRENRRRDAVSPVKRLAEAPGEPECWASEGFPESGQVEIFAWKRGAGLDGVACFLIDRGVVGLKDAWVRMHLDRSQLEKMIQTSEEHGVRMRRVPLAKAKGLVAGGLRWAHHNGMRLPTDWVRAASILGGIGDWASADVSEFRNEFVGHPEDLRRRLIAEPFDTYVKESGVRFIFSDRAPVMDLETGEYLDDDGGSDGEEEAGGEKLKAALEELSPVATTLVSRTRDWLAAADKTPSPELFEAWRSTMLGLFIAKGMLPGGSVEKSNEVFERVMDTLDLRIEPDRRAAYDDAIEQVADHLTADPEMLTRVGKKSRTA
jgi:hypothetical protein